MNPKQSQTLKLAIIINPGSGTAKDLGAPVIAERLERALSQAGNEVVEILDKNPFDFDALEKLAADDRIDGIVACGGDGTISAAAGLCWQHGKILGVLPGGTMNMFARTLGIPLDLEAAIESFGNIAVVDADIATANGRPFIHQFSVGLQPRIVIERSRLGYQSRWSKILAGVRATLSNLSRPPVVPAQIKVADHGDTSGLFSLIAVSNNPHGAGHIPYPDSWDAGTLGLYHAPPMPASQMARLLSDMVMGGWDQSQDITIVRAGKSVNLHFDRLKRGAKASVDGELIPLNKTIEIKLHPGALKVIRPLS